MLFLLGWFSQPSPFFTASKRYPPPTAVVCPSNMDRVECDLKSLALEIKSMIFEEWSYTDAEKQNLRVELSLAGNSDEYHVFLRVGDYKTFRNKVHIYERTPGFDLRVPKSDWVPREEIFDLAREGLSQAKPIREADLRRLASDLQRSPR